MLEEVSAGVLVYRVVGVAKFLLLHYPAGHWDFPKGHVEEGETTTETALRELREETGINEEEVKLKEGFEETIDYVYKKNDELAHKKVIFFLGETEKEAIQISEEHQGYDWVAFDEAKERVTFQNARKLLTKSRAYLRDKDVKVT